jgi:hypothetical protein
MVPRTVYSSGANPNHPEARWMITENSFHRIHTFESTIIPTSINVNPFCSILRIFDHPIAKIIVISVSSEKKRIMGCNDPVITEINLNP